MNQMDSFNGKTDYSDSECSEGDALTLRALLLSEAESLLEFDRVREMLAEEARFYMSREILLESRAVCVADDVRRLQEETSEACLLLNVSGDIGLAGMRDPREPLRRAMLGGVLNGSELIMLCGIFDSVWVAREIVAKMSDDVPILNRIASDIRDLHQLRMNISDALSESGDVLDVASPMLGRLRRRARRAYRRVMGIMDRMANDSALRHFLQSSAVASRNDRLVLEVKSSQRQFVPGIIHDVSASGHTIFVEPYRAVNATNEWREAVAESQREEERVLRKLTREIAFHGEDALASIQAAAMLDAVVARGRLAIKMCGIRPDLQDDVSDRGILLRDAKHPLLADDAVPVSIQLGPSSRGLVITGPNTGGKTVALKTLGLMALMHQSGLHVPVGDGSMLPVFDGVYADIGDAQSIDRSVSTFSSHMQRVVRIVNSATNQSLVLLDELGTGTDPEEGSALARAVLDHLVRIGAWTCITTHHRQVSEFAAMTDELENASVELDPDTMLPNYRLIIGVPGQSYAMLVAERLGLSGQILEHAKSMLDPRRSHIEDLLESLRCERDSLGELQEVAMRDRAESERLLRQAEDSLSSARREREELIESARERLIQESQSVRRQLRRIMREYRGKESWDAGREEAAGIARSLRSGDWMGTDQSLSSDQDMDSSVSSWEDAEADVPQFALGDEVNVESLGLTGKIVDINDDGIAVVMAGSLSFQARPHMMKLVQSANVASNDENEDGTLEVNIPQMSAAHESASDLDVRGSRAHMVEAIIPQFIDRAFMQGLGSIRIIHGEGTGALREAVRTVLSRDPHVEMFQSAPLDEGGDSVTIAVLE